MSWRQSHKITISGPCGEVPSSNKNGWIGGPKNKGGGYMFTWCILNKLESLKAPQSMRLLRVKKDKSQKKARTRYWSGWVTRSIRFAWLGFFCAKKTILLHIFFLSLYIRHICRIYTINMNFIVTLIHTGKTVFSYREIIAIFADQQKRTIDQYLYRAKKKWDLLNPIKGVWALVVYTDHEMAHTIRPTSYISLETVLYDAWAIFQYYGSTTTSISDTSNIYTISEKQYTYKKIKPSLLTNTIWIKEYDTHKIARPERALCDAVYLYPNFGIDNPQAFNQERLNQILPFYPKKTALYISKLLNRNE
jgi:hypothetical protein